MSYCQFARRGFTCALFGAWRADAHASRAQEPTAEIQIVVRSDSGPISRAQVVVRGLTFETDADGRTTLHVGPGAVDITVAKEGFNPVTVSATAAPGPPQVIPILLERQIAIEEHVTV